MNKIKNANDIKINCLPPPQLMYSSEWEEMQHGWPASQIFSERARWSESEMQEEFSDTTGQRELSDVLYNDSVDKILNITVSYRTDGERPNYIGDIK